MIVLDFGALNNHIGYTMAPRSKAWVQIFPSPIANLYAAADADTMALMEPLARAVAKAVYTVHAKARIMAIAVLQEVRTHTVDFERSFATKLPAAGNLAERALDGMSSGEPFAKKSFAASALPLTLAREFVVAKMRVRVPYLIAFSGLSVDDR